MKIAKNDPALAHSQAKRMLQTRATQVLKKQPSAKQAYAYFTQLYGDDILHSEIARDKGSRANWWILFLTWESDGVCLKLCQHKSSNLAIRTFARITHHALARMLQRTIGSADYSAVRLVCKRLGLTVLDGVRKGDSPSEFCNVAFPDGALLGEYADGVLTYKTWVSADNAANPKLTRACNSVAAADAPDPGT